MFCSFSRLDEALAQYFGEGTEVAQQEAIYPSMPEPIRKCPQCNKDMVLKTKKNGGSVPNLKRTSAYPALDGLAGHSLQGPVVSFLCHYLKVGLPLPALGLGYRR